MNYSMGASPEIIGNDDADYMLNEVNRALTKFPRGTGSYGPLVPLEADAKALINANPNLVGTPLDIAHKKLLSLLEEEMSIASNRAITGGISTEEKEQEKLVQFNIRRDAMIGSPTAAEQVKPKSNLVRNILVLGAVGAGAYFMFKG